MEPVGRRRQAVARRVAAVVAVVGLALAFVLLADGVGAGAGSGQHGDAPGRAAVGDSGQAVAGTVVVHPGDTLWGVAVHHAPPGSDPRVYLERLRALNGIEGSRVAAWTVLQLPAR